jgi:hypothetical protein
MNKKICMAGVTKKAESALRSCLEILFSKFIVENLKSPPYPSALLLAGLCYVAQANLKFTILLPQFPECWDDRAVPSHPSLEYQVLTMAVKKG